MQNALRAALKHNINEWQEQAIKGQVQKRLSKLKGYNLSPCHLDFILSNDADALLTAFSEAVTIREQVIAEIGNLCNRDLLNKLEEDPNDIDDN